MSISTWDRCLLARAEGELSLWLVQIRSTELFEEQRIFLVPPSPAVRELWGERQVGSVNMGIYLQTPHRVRWRELCVPLEATITAIASARLYNNQQADSNRCALVSRLTECLLLMIGMEDDLLDD